MSTWSRWQRGWVAEHPALITTEGTLTYGGLTQRVARAAGWLRGRGVTQGNVVALQLPRCLAFLELHLACLAIGAATLPMNDRYTAREVAFLLDDSDARLAVLTDRVAAELGRGVPASSARGELDSAPEDALDAVVSPDTLAVLCYTSGTTGRPKGACILHRNLIATVEALHTAWRWCSDDVIVHALPMYHIHGLFLAQHGALRAGAVAVWLDAFTADAALGALARHHGTIFMGVPTFYHRLLQVADPLPDLSSVRLFTSGSAPLPAQVHREFEARFGHRILERYGMTEVGIVLSNPYDGERRPGAVGFALPQVEAKVIRADGVRADVGEVGQICIAGPSVCAGYLGLPDRTASAIVDGWMHTGDLGRVDADGYFHVVGRSKDLILVGGLNVYPRAVESVLCDHPGVAEAAVVGVPDADLGERVVAAVVPRGVYGSVDPNALAAWCRERLAAYKCPRAFHFVLELPRNNMGKVTKQVLRDRFAEGAS
ncbi:MAG: malonyl-CoA/methylmalonyl-CoA synthetase [Myxococcota bacterium]|jgi:malonyl-CoA/methylmalonyl-CoA synthetase